MLSLNYFYKWIDLSIRFMKRTKLLSKSIVDKSSKKLKKEVVYYLFLFLEAEFLLYFWNLRVILSTLL